MYLRSITDIIQEWLNREEKELNDNVFTTRETKDIEARQSTLNIKTPTSVAVIGVGGVGMWVALQMALSGVNKIMLVDPDVVERSNLNRTMFRITDVDKPKVEAVMELILERRYCEITPVRERVENIGLDIFSDYEVIVDCKDNAEPLDPELQKKCRITGGYDGMNITMHINPSGDSTWGESSSYTIVPSWLIPPTLIACIITTYIMASRPRTKEFIHNFNVKDLIRTILAVPESEVKEVTDASV